MMRRDEVVVGVDGTPESVAALEYALWQGQDLGAPVHLVHAVPVLGPVPPLRAIGADRLFDNGQELLADLVRRAHLAAPSVEVRTTLHVGAPVPVLVEAARTAILVVLGSTRTADTRSLFGGSTIEKVTMRADCPVRAVPDGWRPQGRGRDVVVGIQDVVAEPEEATQGSAQDSDQDSDRDPARGLAFRERLLLERAFSVAEPGGVVVVVHAWQVPAGYEELVDDAAAEASRIELAECVQQAIAPVRARFPDVPVQVKVVRGAPADVLAAESERAALVLVGRGLRRGPLAHLGAHLDGHLGGVTRDLLRVAHCPVEVGPPDADLPIELDLTLEKDGAMLR